MILNKNTKIISEIENVAVKKAVSSLERDFKNVFVSASEHEGYNFHNIWLVQADSKTEMGIEMFEIHGTSKGLEIHASEELGFIYGIYEISKRFLDVNEFWFWNDQNFITKDKVVIENGFFFQSKPCKVKLRGWFVNDEVLLHTWKLEQSKSKPWEMVFETLLRLGGNMVIPGTGKNGEKYRELAASMGLYISHHHAEPLGAKMFSNVYPNLNPSYDEHPEKFRQVWLNGIQNQEHYKVVWNLGFRGQGDCPFWENDPKYATSKERGKLISELIKLQYELVREKRPNDICCTNLYGEVLELYREDCIDIPDEIIKIWADNGFGKMVSRRQDNHNPRIPAFAEKSDTGKQGIYYHVSFYDLQAANHMTMLPNSPEFVFNELNKVLQNNMDEYWIINCSNVKPHTFYLDFIAKIWRGDSITPQEHQRQYIEKYFGVQNIAGICACFEQYFRSAISFGKNEDEHAGEQFVNHVPRLLITQFLRNKNITSNELMWATGDIDYISQIMWFKNLCKKGVKSYKLLVEQCEKASVDLLGNQRIFFEDSLMLQSKIYYECYSGALDICNSLLYGINEGYQEAFYLAGRARKNYLRANGEMRKCEHGKWYLFYENDCLTDIKQTAWVLETLMGYFRNLGDGPHYYQWQREFLYTEDERRVMLILNMENHLKDLELYKLMEAKFEGKNYGEYER